MKKIFQEVSLGDIKASRSSFRQLLHKVEKFSNKQCNDFDETFHKDALDIWDERLDKSFSTERLVFV